LPGNVFLGNAVGPANTDSFLCESRHSPEEPLKLKSADAKYGNYYLSASRLNFGEEESPAFLLLWTKEDARWKGVGWAIDAPKAAYAKY